MQESSSRHVVVAADQLALAVGAEAGKRPERELARRQGLVRRTTCPCPRRRRRGFARRRSRTGSRSPTVASPTLTRCDLFVDRDVGRIEGVGQPHGGRFRATARPGCPGRRIARSLPRPVPRPRRKAIPGRRSRRRRRAGRCTRPTRRSLCAPRLTPRLAPAPAEQPVVLGHQLVVLDHVERRGHGPGIGRDEEGGRANRLIELGPGGGIRPQRAVDPAVRSPMSATPNAR